MSGAQAWTELPWTFIAGVLRRVSVRSKECLLTQLAVGFFQYLRYTAVAAGDNRVFIQGVPCSAVILSVSCCFASLRHWSGPHPRKLRSI